MQQTLIWLLVNFYNTILSYFPQTNEAVSLDPAGGSDPDSWLDPWTFKTAYAAVCVCVCVCGIIV